MRSGGTRGYRRRAPRPPGTARARGRAGVTPHPPPWTAARPAYWLVAPKAGRLERTLGRPPTARERLGPRTPVEGVLTAGASATTGPGLPFVGLSAALVAEVVGRAERG